MFKKTHWLQELYKEGKLKKILKRFGDELNEDNVLGYGTQVYCFGKKKDKKVLKLVPKKIRFFSEPSFKSFKDEINELEPFFIPVLKIIYEDENIFIYSQHVCRKVAVRDYSENSPYLIMSIILMIIAMLLKNKIVTDIGPHNIGIYHRNIGIFDCHGLQRIDFNTTWYTRLVINLERYVSHYYKGNLTEIFLTNDINLIVKTLSRELFDPLYREHYKHLSDKKREIIDSKLEIIMSISSQNI